MAVFNRSEMEWYELVSLGALAICLASCLFHFVRLVRRGNPVDYAVRAGETSKAIIYSFSGAMSPAKKESAYLHLPVYVAGILYHLGTFLAIFLFFILIYGISVTGVIKDVVAIFLIVTSLSGLWILVKRTLSPVLRSLSNPDDYISNLLVTLFQVFTICVIYLTTLNVVYFLTAALLLLYLPLGKLRHAVYFFAARYHLGYFYGYRGTWPPVKQNS
jgi:hypothetical protein